MQTVEEIRKLLSEHKRELHERFHVCGIALFGSYARHEQSPASDVDILVEFDQPVGWEVVDLREFLEELLGMKVDLVTKGAVERKPLLWRFIQQDLIYV